MYGIGADQHWQYVVSSTQCFYISPSYWVANPSVERSFGWRCAVLCCAVQAGQFAGGVLGSAAAGNALRTAVRSQVMSEQESAAWLLDLAGSCPLADLATRGIPACIDRCGALQQSFLLWFGTAWLSTAVGLDMCVFE
jgi:hypothetical protein